MFPPSFPLKFRGQYFVSQQRKSRWCYVVRGTRNSLFVFVHRQHNDVILRGIRASCTKHTSCFLHQLLSVPAVLTPHGLNNELSEVIVNGRSIKYSVHLFCKYTVAKLIKWNMNLILILCLFYQVNQVHNFNVLNKSINSTTF